MVVGKILFIGVVRGKLTNENVFLTRQFKRENLVGQQENVKAVFRPVFQAQYNFFAVSFSVSSSYSFFCSLFSVSSRYSQFFS